MSNRSGRITACIVAVMMLAGCGTKSEEAVPADDTAVSVETQAETEAENDVSEETTVVESTELLDTSAKTDAVTDEETVSETSEETTEETVTKKKGKRNKKTTDKTSTESNTETAEETTVVSDAELTDKTESAVTSVPNIETFPETFPETIPAITVQPPVETTVIISEKKPEKTSAETTAETVKEIIVNTAADTKTRKPADETAVLPMYTTEKSDNNIYAPDNKKVKLIESSFTQVKISNREEYPELAMAVDSKNYELNIGFNQMIDEISEYAGMDYENYPERFTVDKMCYTDKTEAYVMRCDDQVFSYLMREEGYGGGVHGWTVFTGVNVDSETGKIIELNDFVADKDKLIKLLGKRLEKEYPGLVGSIDESSSGAEMLKNAYGSGLNGFTKTYDSGESFDYPPIGFVFTPGGVTFFSNYYELTAYAGGVQQITLMFNDPETAGIFSKDYISNEDVPYEVQMTLDFSNLQFDIDCDGTAEKINIDWKYDDEWKLEGLTINVNDKKYDIDYSADDYEEYPAVIALEHTDGKHNKIAVYSMKGNIIKELDI